MVFYSWLNHTLWLALLASEKIHPYLLLMNTQSSCGTIQITSFICSAFSSVFTRTVWPSISDDHRPSIPTN